MRLKFAARVKLKVERGVAGAFVINQILCIPISFSLLERDGFSDKLKHFFIPDGRNTVNEYRHILAKK